MIPKITVSTSTHRRPDLLARCIKSIQNQTFQDYEHIIFSDHCPRARDVYEDFKEDSRIKFFENRRSHIKNVGAVGQNYAIVNASSDIICYCNDDNIFLPNHLKVLYDNLLHSEIVYTRSYSVKMGTGSNVIEKIISRNLEDDCRIKLGDEGVLESPIDMLRLGHHIKVIGAVGPWKSWSLMEAMGYGKPHNEDGEFIMRLEKYSQAHHVDDFSAVYYDRSACKIKDTSYDESLKNMPDGQTYVFPDILKQTGII